MLNSKKSDQKSNQSRPIEKILDDLDVPGDELEDEDVDGEGDKIRDNCNTGVNHHDYAGGAVAGQTNGYLWIWKKF